MQEVVVDVLPVVLRPGNHQTTEGAVEVSTAAFAEKVLSSLPDDALLFRMADTPGTLEGDPGARVFVPLSVDRARLLVDRNVRIVASSQDEKTQDIRETFQPCSKDLAGLVLAQAQTDPHVRPLRSLVSYPVYLPGFDLAQPGWNAKSGTFYDEPPHLAGLKPSEDPSTADLADFILDFHLKDEASRQNVYALMLTRILRPAIDGPTPFFFVMSSIERSGKGKLLDTCSVAVCGNPMAIMQVGGEEDEREKRITSLILRGASAVHFDNVPQGESFDSAAIASLATAYPNWGGRILGGSNTTSLPNNLVVAFSGNNPQATGELVKRCVPIAWDATDDHPELRTEFVNDQDNIAWAHKNRVMVLSTLMGMVEKWKAAGRPMAPFRMGGFERWSAAVLGVLFACGATEAMSNYREWCVSANDKDSDIADLIDSWALHHQTSSITASQVLELVEKAGLFPAVLARPSKSGQMVALARVVLSHLVDRPVGNWTVRKTKSGSSATYSLTKNYA